MSNKTNAEFTAEVEKVLNVVRPSLAMHAGNVELVRTDVETGRVEVRLQGTCVGCPMADLTLKAGIEETLKDLIPEVTEVVAVDPEEAVQ